MKKYDGTNDFHTAGSDRVLLSAVAAEIAKKMSLSRRLTCIILQCPMNATRHFFFLCELINNMNAEKNTIYYPAGTHWRMLKGPFREGQLIHYMDWNIRNLQINLHFTNAKTHTYTPSHFYLCGTNPNPEPLMDIIECSYPNFSPNHPNLLHYYQP